MARIFPLLWPVSLILCCCWSQANSIGQIKLTGNVPQASRTPVELRCEPHSRELMDLGVYWVRQNLDLSTHFILRTSPRSKSTPETVRGYTGSASYTSNTYLLKIASFGEEYEGIYYCLFFRNQAVHLSSGLKVYLPKATTIAPKVSTPSERLTTTMKFPHSTASDPDDDVMFPCELYIWAPLAGGCFLLLVMLVITLSVCCDPRRRRRHCRCKRPLNGTNGTATMSRLIN
ncbi:T-cell surface glycoprotein CD8 alpha chain [Zootoca vivipara]|uniref:T-cell surface glycoprotein CD8 alpha chain n=1 Tax=Zootoca vivipara TaxID=8524 RepID=UPI00158FD9CC|nr:T-cell surface glycoprotein CD8 alpha chain [Zootoca vivipara]XP_060138293.1 T-cell surface glycoprotein CD8 alpha chain [Zootoca vivipara]